MDCFCDTTIGRELDFAEEDLGVPITLAADTIVLILM
jgi:hypothetical protein